MYIHKDLAICTVPLGTTHRCYVYYFLNLWNWKNSVFPWLSCGSFLLLLVHRTSHKKCILIPLAAVQWTHSLHTLSTSTVHLEGRSDGKREDWSPAFLWQGFRNDISNTSYPWLPITDSLRDWCSPSCHINLCK